MYPFSGVFLTYAKVVCDMLLTTQCLSFPLLFPGKPQSIESSERVQLSGTYNVRKGKLQLPVNRWTRRQVILCGTCLIVSSVKESQTGKMHILPLIGGKVRKSHTHIHTHTRALLALPNVFFFSSWSLMGVLYNLCFGS